MRNYRNITSGSYMVHSIGGIDMREIKFRAWNEWADRNEMIYFRIDEPKAIENTAWNAKIMQYTGLKDKNGKEIYEGDILLYNNYIKTVISYKNGAFVRSYENSNIYLLYDSFITDGRLDDYEVIGNIYEDKHLLEEEI